MHFLRIIGRVARSQGCGGAATAVDPALIWFPDRSWVARITAYRAVAFLPDICSNEHINDPHLIPPSVAECLTEIERSVQRFRSSYSLGTDPERLLTDEIITMRVELIRLWSEISSGKHLHMGR